jgi:uncharacterized membrane protein
MGLPCGSWPGRSLGRFGLSLGGSFYGGCGVEKIFKRICLIVFTCFILLASCTTQRVTVDTDGLEHQRRIVELENRVRDYEDRIRQ